MSELVEEAGAGGKHLIIGKGRLRNGCGLPEDRLRHGQKSIVLSMPHLEDIMPASDGSLQA